MLRGEVWWVDFSSSMGGETTKIRPAIIVSNDASNKVMNHVQVVPTTSNAENCYPCETLVDVNGKLSKAMADQMTKVSKLRLKNKIGKVSHHQMMDVERVMKVQLGLID